MSAVMAGNTPMEMVKVKQTQNANNQIWGSKVNADWHLSGFFSPFSSPLIFSFSHLPEDFYHGDFLLVCLRSRLVFALCGRRRVAQSLSERTKKLLIKVASTGLRDGVRTSAHQIERVLVLRRLPRLPVLIELEKLLERRRRRTGDTLGGR